jgi:cell division septation protein DedD
VAKPKAPVRPKVAKKLTARADTPGAPLNIAPGSLPVRTASAEPPAAAAPRSGGTAVQIASALSEEEARSTMSRMRGRFPELAGAALGIQRAQVNGATRFRVRATGLSADAAQQLCSSLKGKGAACFVTR